MGFPKMAFCKRNHPLTPDNVYWHRGKDDVVRPVCKTCRRHNQRKAYARKQAAAGREYLPQYRYRDDSDLLEQS